MHSSGSFLYTCIDRVRHMCDTPETDRHSNDYIVNECVMPAFAETFTELRKTDEHPVLMLMTLSLVRGTDRYLLPPNVGEVVRLGKLDATTESVTHDWRQRNEFSPIGPGWYVEGNELTFRPSLDSDDNWLLFYIPSGDMLLHFGVGAVGTAQESIVLATTPELGQLDRRPNAYVGAVLRILQDGKLWQERIIGTYDAKTRTATPRLLFDTSELPDAGAPVTYEIAPFCHQAMIQAISAYAALTLSPSKGFSQPKKIDIDVIRARALRTLRDHYGNFLVRTAKGVQRLTYDHPRLNDPSGIVTLWR